MGNGIDIIVNERDVASLKEDFKNYLKSAYAHLKNPEQVYTDAFYLYRYNVGINFWKALENEETMNEARELLEKFQTNENKYKDPKGNSYVYLRSMKILKEFIDKNYSGVVNYIKGLNANNNGLRNYFFVFQNKSYEKERGGGYLWAPKSSNGRKISHWQMMTNVKKGDLIIHSYFKKIVAFSIAKTDVYSSRQPRELEDEQLWENDGWRVDTEYFDINDPIVTSDYMDDIRKLQPRENAPFNVRGRGNTGYLFAANKELVTFLLKMSENNQSNKDDRDWIKKIRTDFGLIYIDEEEVNDDEVLLKVLNEHSLIENDKEVEYKGKPREKLEANKSKEGRLAYPRNPQTAANALKLARYSCEIDPAHKTFIRKKDGLPYTEPHHLVPLSKFEEFNYSLDVEENIVSLCSHCHNHLHYGIDIEETLKQLYEARKDALKNSGINISFEELLTYYK